MKNHIFQIGIFMGILLPTLIFGQFKAEKQVRAENLLMAPCCGGGTLAEHDDNTHTRNMKVILTELTSEDFDKEEALGLFKMAYSQQGMFTMGYSPATIRSIESILAHVEDALHPGMTEEQISDLFAWIHNEKIRAAPSEQGFGIIAYRTPAIIIVLAIIAVSILVRYKIRTAQPAAVTVKNDSTLEAKIQKEMEKLDI